jgi:hypothetical protein
MRDLQQRLTSHTDSWCISSSTWTAKSPLRARPTPSILQVKPTKHRNDADGKSQRSLVCCFTVCAPSRAQRIKRRVNRSLTRSRLRNITYFKRTGSYFKSHWKTNKNESENFSRAGPETNLNRNPLPNLVYGKLQQQAHSRSANHRAKTSSQ